ncbi:phosphatase PAP2 family protein [Sanguibacter sp. 4.1]|uniref:Phosphatase PAP2 family protein n=1 Tax=Sanguibacter biliveldensis TaxID=3030830 RepID=A0AAF0Z7I7_9MICO|nr:phosphatase PAP2 family protein [Sanguibacter sp. 4.1]WPF81891.1 phosphatase PAP2 family protein [Sanguibacter sp. 4.1]
MNSDRRPGVLPAAGASGAARRGRPAPSTRATQVLPTGPAGPRGPVGPASTVTSAGSPAGRPRAGGHRPPSAPRGADLWTGVPVRTRLLAVLVAVAAAAGIVVVWEVFVATRTGQVIEDYAYDGALTGRTRLWTVAEPVLGVVSVSFVVLGTLAAILAALVRRRWLLAVQALVLVGGANLTTQVLKKIVLERPVFDSEMWWTNSLPSGHTTVAASVSVALLLTVPRLARPWVAIFGAGYTAATGISTLVGQWHRPSDVVAAVLVVLFWGALACALTTRDAQDPGPADDRPRKISAPKGSSSAWVLAILGVAGTGAAGVALWALQQTATVVDGSGQPFTSQAELVAYAGGAAGVVAATAVSFGLLLALRQTVARPRSTASRSGQV